MEFNTDILLITPPFIQLNTPYPATPSLKGFLQEQGFKAAQLDLSIEVILELLSKNGLTQLFAFTEGKTYSKNANLIIENKEEYIRYIDAVIEFLQGKDSSIMYSINQGLLPKAVNFELQQDLDWHYGSDGMYDKAKFFATQFIEDLGEFITECIDERFGFSRYAERIALNALDYQVLMDELKLESPITDIMFQILKESIEEHQPKIIGFTIPFPGNLLMALKSAEYIKANYPDIKIILGGGYVNTELRSLKEPRLFELVDFVCLDDGELTLSKLLKHILKGESELARTFVLEDGVVKFIHNTTDRDFGHQDCGTPDYDGLPLEEYISVTETTNPMHNLWTNGRWNKMVLAHGCYWKRCTFCDISLDYVKRYDSTDEEVLCNRIESIIKQTGYNGFHFVDEAAPPALMRKLAEEILKRGLVITWWTNIRFEPAFTTELCALLAKSGCIAVSGGLEVASERILKKINKGISLKGVARVANAFQKSGIMIHAYLMYGFPTQTAQETIDSLEVVRQLFENKLLQSAFWHQFAMTVHSPVGLTPELFDVERIPHPENSFAQNGCEHLDPKGCDHSKYGDGLNKALFNYLHDNGLDFKLHEWFDFTVPKTKIPKNYIKQFIAK